VFGYDKDFHMRVQLVLCKVHCCQQLMQQYLKDIGSSAQLLYTGTGQFVLSKHLLHMRECCY
jgi:hypothetical protein